MSVRKMFHTVTQKFYTFGRYTMKRQRIFAGVLALGLLLALVAGGTLAQEPQEDLASQDTASTLLGTSLGTAFTYQGRLMDDSGAPLTGSYDFQFKLYDAASGVSQVGSTVTVGDVDISDGLFTAQLDFGGSAFTGDARWLEIGVRAGSSTGAYTTLSPRQPLTPAPYALSLRPGADVKGDVDGVTSLLYVHNDGTGYGVWGYGNSGRGVYGTSSSGFGIYGYSPSGTGVYGQSNSATNYGVHGENTSSGTGVYGESSSGDGVKGESTDGDGVRGKSTSGYGVHGISTDGIGVSGWSDNAWGVRGYSGSSDHAAVYACNNHGVALLATCSGIIESTADSVLYLSPHDMVVRGGSGVSVTPMDSGGVDIYHWITGDKYLSIPVSTFGTLFGSPVYVKSIEVCYKTDAEGYIDVTSVRKNNGSTGSTSYLSNGTNCTSSTHTCYTTNAGGTRVVIDNSTWVQFNISTSGTGHTYIYTVKLTLSEQQN